MKYLVILGDGMADYPVEQLNGKTPLEVAKKPMIDYLAMRGKMGLSRNVPFSQKPGSDNANLSALGYDPIKNYSGRSPLEAVSIGVPLVDGDVTYRCNLVSLSDDEPYESKTMLDYSSDEITTEEAEKLIVTLKDYVDTDELSLFNGISYRHCLRWRNAVSGKTELTPPHDISDKPIADYLPKGENGEKLLSIMKRSNAILKKHPVNLDRISRGLRPANSCWFWGEGTKPSLESFKSRFGLDGAMISAVDLLKGIGICAGLDVVEVKGATGTVKTNFTGKMLAAKQAFESGKDFVYIHMEAPDECGHRGEVENKVLSIELIDEKVVKPLFDYLKGTGEPFRILVLPDHPTPLCLRTHVKDPVPFVLYDSENEVQGEKNYTEKNAASTGVTYEDGYKLMPDFLGK